MTDEEKQLLIKALCSYLPYGTYVHHKNCPDTKFKLIAVFDDGRIGVTVNEIQLTPTSINECKPYLRPMSSMTEEEYKSVSWEGCSHTYNYSLKSGFRFVEIKTFTLNILNWLNANHFDYRGLIPMGLALEAKEGMYKTY